jgi:hypothetical protein
VSVERKYGAKRCAMLDDSHWNAEGFCYTDLLSPKTREAYEKFLANNTHQRTIHMTTTQQYIPSVDDIPATSQKWWRIANGEFRVGTDKDSSLETKSRLAGKLIKCGHLARVNSYKRDDPEELFLVSIETAEGPVTAYVKIFAEGKWRGFSIAFGLMRSLLQIAAGEMILLEPVLGKPTENTNGIEYTPSYVNVSIVPVVETADGPRPGRPRRVQLPKQEGEFDASAPFALLLNELQSHPAWGSYERAKDDEGDEPDTSIEGLLSGYCQGRGWPNFKTYEAQYSDDICKILKAGSIDELAWEAVKALLDKANKPPKSVRDAEAIDPFAD